MQSAAVAYTVHRFGLILFSAVSVMFVCIYQPEAVGISLFLANTVQICLSLSFERKLDREEVTTDTPV